MITVACVLRSGGDYTAEDVHRLQVGVARHLSLPHRFACFSDVEVPCHRVPLTSDWPGWWAKMELFRPDIPGDLLYFDLDTVITGSLDAIATVNRFAILRDFYRGGNAFQSSAMYLPEATRREVWRQWARDPLGHMKAHRGGGDQAFLETCGLTCTFWQDVLPQKFVSYKVHIRTPHQHPRETGNGKVPPEASVVVFHGKPRPRDVGWLQSEKRRSCLVLGGASSVWTDVEAALDLGEYDGVVATNDAGTVWPGKLDAWVTLHPEKLRNWIEQRRANGFDMNLTTWSNHGGTNRGHDKGIVHRTTQDWKGSSGLFAVKVAREMGFDRIVLCGVPMTVEGAHFFDPKPWSDGRNYRKGWIARQAEIAPFVRSMSGWTRELFTAPTSDWLASPTA